MTNRTTIKPGAIRPLMALFLVLPLLSCGLEDGTSAATGGVLPLPGVLGWVAPDQREDGTALLPTEIGGYRIYYGTAQGDYQKEFEITSAAVNSLSFPDDLVLPAGTYYFVVTTYDTADRESLYSPEIVISL